jgi:hypothetical protein
MALLSGTYHPPTPVSRSTETDLPPVKTTPKVDVDVLAAIDTEWLEDAFIYVHCHVPDQWKDMLIRIWRTTFLIDPEGTARASLLHAINITYTPLWTHVPRHGKYTFLLIFEMLPKSCRAFDLVEEIPQPGGFHVPGIVRNQSDVYHITLD